MRAHKTPLLSGLLDLEQYVCETLRRISDAYNEDNTDQLMMIVNGKYSNGDNDNSKNIDNNDNDDDNNSCSYTNDNCKSDKDKTDDISNADNESNINDIMMIMTVMSMMITKVLMIINENDYMGYIIIITKVILLMILL